MSEPAPPPPSGPGQEPHGSAVTRLTGTLPVRPPGKRRRWLLGLLGTGVVLLALYAALPWLIPVPWLCRTICEDLSQQLSRGQPHPITVTLDASRSSVSWQEGIVLSDLRVGPIPGFGNQPFLTVQRLQGDFSPLWFLLTRHLHRLVVTEPVVNVVLDRERRLNLQALPSGKNDVPAFDILIEGGEVHVYNEATTQTLVADLKRIHAEIDVSAAKARLSGELLESLKLDGQVLIDPADASPIRFAVELNLPALNPALGLGGECRVGWDWVDLKQIHSEQLVSRVTGSTSQPASTSAEDVPDWWLALTEGRIGGLSRASFTVQLLPDSRVRFRGEVQGKNLALPGLTQDELSANLEGTWDPITKSVELSNMQAAGDGWSVLPGTTVSLRPEADQTLNVQAKLALEPDRLAKAFGQPLPKGVKVQGRLEMDLDYVQRLTDERLQWDLDFTPLSVQVAGWVNKPAGAPMSFAGSGTWPLAAKGLLTIEHVMFKAPGLFAALDFVDLPAARRLTHEWRKWLEDLPAGGPLNADDVRRMFGLLGKTLGKLTAQFTLRLDSFQQSAGWLVPLAEPTQSGQLAGGFVLRAAYQPVDLVDETGQVQISVESQSDRPLKIFSWVDKPAGRLLTAETGWQMNLETGAFRRFTAETDLGRARMRLGTDAAWQVQLDDDPAGEDLRVTTDLRLPIRLEGLEQWLTACPCACAQLRSQQIVGNARLDLTLRGQLRIRPDDPQPNWQIEALRIGMELDAENLSLVLRSLPNGAPPDFTHAQDRPLKLSGDYRYLAEAEVPHELWLQAALDGGQVELSAGWNDRQQDALVALEVQNASTLLAQFPQLNKSLVGRGISGSGGAALHWQATGEENHWHHQATVSGDLTRLKLALRDERFFKDAGIPLRVEADVQADVRGGDLRRLGAETKIRYDHSHAVLSASADLRAGNDPLVLVPADVWLAAGAVERANVRFDLELALSNSLRAGLPSLGQFANKYGLVGSAKVLGEFAGQPGEWAGSFDLDLQEAGFVWRNWVRKRPGTPAGVSLPVLIARQPKGEPATLNAIWGNVRVGATRLDFSGEVSGQLETTPTPTGLPQIAALQVQEARGWAMLCVPEVAEWAKLCPELSDGKPAGALRADLLASWTPAEFKVENLDFSAEELRLEYAGEEVGFHGSFSFSPQRLDVPVSQITVGGQKVGLMAEVADPSGQPAGQVYLSAKDFDQRELSRWLCTACNDWKKDSAELFCPGSQPASQPAPIPLSPDYFESNPAVYTPPAIAAIFAQAKSWNLAGELFSEHALIALTQQDGPKLADDVSIRWRVAEGAFRMDFSAAQSGGLISGFLAFPLTEPNPIFQLSLNFRDVLWPHTSAHTRFPGLWLYGYEDRQRANLHPDAYDLPNPAITGAGSFYTLLDSSTARLFGPGGVMFYEGPGNWHVGGGVMIFGPGYLLGPTNQPTFAKLFPGLNTERLELERVFNWYEKTADGYQNDNMLFLNRSGNPLIPTYNFFAVGTTQKASTPDPLDSKYLLGNYVDYQIGLDLIGQPNANWKEEKVGRVPLFRKTGYMVPGDSQYWNPARGTYSAGKLVDERIAFTPQDLVESLLWQASPLRNAYQQILNQWHKWQESMKK